VSPPAARAITPGDNRLPAIILGVLAAVLLSVVFWFPLWTGGGLVGSDIYAYYLPQKAYFADRLHAGELPLWNNLIGHGYPQVAESQTGVFYPLHWLLYPLFDLNTAFSASIIAHYILAFVFTFMYARRIGLLLLGAGLAGLVYTYGWFPPRVCLEWSIVGGAWLPAALWCAESFIQTRRWRYSLLLTAVLGTQMLAGHFMLAFITQLTLAGYVPLRLWLSAGDLSAETRSAWRTTCVALLAAAAAAFLVAAVQLLPTWELKQLSQRQGVTQEHDPGYGYIPPRYLSQIALPWVWYPDDPDETSFKKTVTPGGSRTNRVEAHLYFGLIPLVLIGWEIWHWRRGCNRRLAVWLILGLAALVYTPGWLLPLTKHLPGFSFFEGPGRFGVVTTLAAGLLAGSGFEKLEVFVLEACRNSRLRRSSRSVVQWLLTILVIGATTADLFLVSRLVTYAYLVQNPPIKLLADSPVRRFFSGQSQPARIFSEAKNLPSLLGVATVPTYLGLGPAQYFDPQFMLPQPWPFATPPTAGQLDWFRRAGVTHYLSFRAVDPKAWSARLVWEGPDPFLNSALARPIEAPLYLYELRGGRGRVSLEDEQRPWPDPGIVSYGANRVVSEAESRSAGRLILTDLAWPGWNVAVDAQSVGSVVVDGMFRGVDLPAGKHTVVWTYQPAALYWGAGISVLSIIILLAIAHVRFWHPSKVQKIEDRS
jgi:hypothetical protein